MTFSLAAPDVPSPQEKEYGLGEVQHPPATACWRKSSASGQDGGACVQITCTNEHVWVRDSKNPLGPYLGFTRGEWTVFLVGVQRDEFDRSTMPACAPPASGASPV
ncbi:MAG: DUF397 domain-containing protein [Pseudonocardiaceae bacterium]